MIRRLIGLALVLLLGWIVYVQFYGTDEQKTARKQLFENLRQTGKTIGDIAKVEQLKLKDISFKDALGKVGESIDKLRQNASNLKQEYREKLDDLQSRKRELEDLLHIAQSKPDSEITPEQEAAAKQKLRDLSVEMQTLAKQIENDEQALEQQP
ncbi:MAG: hypothetical protein IPL35_08020 [Sphingobacteriales bacterium]|nr:hypothetical protein [Sphingobacteriales bacterium]